MGRPVHFEILVDDPRSLAMFYEAVFGWEVSRWDDPEQGYFLLTTGGGDHGGINGALMGRHFDQKVINTIEVDDLDTALESIKDAGGELVHGPNEVPNVGLHAYCKDPAGVLFGVMQSHNQG